MERTVPIQDIQTHGRTRLTKLAFVNQLAASIREVGLLNPLVVTEEADGKWWLVSGLHRLEALRHLEWEQIPVHVMELSEADRIIAECDENLVRFMSPGDEAKFTAKKQDAYWVKYPETRPHTAGAIASNRAQGRGGEVAAANFAAATGEAKSPADPRPSFSEAQAALTGKSETAVKRDAQRGREIREDVLDAMRDAGVDSGVNLDRVRALPKGQQAAAADAIIAQARARKAAREVPVPPKPKVEARNNQMRMAAVIQEMEKPFNSVDVLIAANIPDNDGNRGLATKIIDVLVMFDLVEKGEAGAFIRKPEVEVMCDRWEVLSEDDKGRFRDYIDSREES